MAEDDEPVAGETRENGEMSEAEIDGNLAASFPASDPPSWTLGTNHQEETRGERPNAAEDDGAE